MPTRLSALALAIATMLAALAPLTVAPADRTAVARHAEPTGTPPSATTRSGCRAEAARDVDAARVGLSDTVSVTLTLQGCLPKVHPLHIALVVDSDLGDAGEARRAQSALLDLVEAFDLPANPATRVAVVSFGAAVHTLSALTNDDQRVRGAIRRARGAVGDQVARGIDSGRRELVRGRQGLDPDWTREVLVLFSGADWESDTCVRALSAAEAVKGEGILLITVRSSRSFNGSVQCMRKIATSPRYFFEAASVGQIVHVFDTIRNQDDFSQPRAVGITITDTIAPAFVVDAASVLPPASSTSPDGRTLRWALPTTMTFPAAAITVTYHLRPLALGEWPVSLGATAAFTDARGARATIAFPQSSVDVVDPATADARVCPAARAAVPADVIAAALARPDAVSGWGLRCSANQPAGPTNPPRRSLRLARPGMAYHPVANGLVWGCGCR
ncbi:MAG: vWA domain-containing protein [Ardenticatenales bacterium]